MLKVVLRKGVPGDVRALAGLWMNLFDLHAGLDPVFQRSANARRKWAEFAREKMSSPESFVFVATSAGRPVGYILGSISKFPPVFKVRRHGFISDMYVDPRFQRRGIGRKLVTKALAWFRKGRIRIVEMVWATPNVKAGMFWRRMGFRPCSERCRLRL